ncbi:MAG: LytTR family DNA-binding domain-containing protein, partial [Hyphomonas sp.]
SLLHTQDKEAAIRRTIKSLETDLPADRFVRIHRSSIVSIEHIREIRMLHKGEAQILLKDGTIVRTSRSYRDVIQKLIDDL